MGSQRVKHKWATNTFTIHILPSFVVPLQVKYSLGAKQILDFSSTLGFWLSLLLHPQTWTMSLLSLPTTHGSILEVLWEVSTLYSLPEAEFLLPFWWPWLGFSTPRLWINSPKERPYGDFYSKPKGLFIGLTHLFSELPLEITTSVTDTRKQLSTKGRQSQE